MKEISIEESAVEYFKDGFLCAEAILMAVADKHHINSPLIPKIATAFGRGLANTNDMCGALSGGILALSLLQGRENKDESFELLYKNISTLKKDFHKKFNQHKCDKLLGFSLNDEDAKDKFVKHDCKECKGSKYVAFVAKRVNELV